MISYNPSNSPRRLDPGAEVLRPGLRAPAPAAGRVQAGGQLQRPPRLQAGHGRELHLLQVREIILSHKQTTY